ncbi:hypothetical protein BDW02DRAFT_599073 [Decorospora gaudefroyi]|uniref:Uncharacterized protein n=1 Tax=Decorospora gaudefroyi TaxID=184978 RepID=A0A6A5K7U9_9PLEO|nr:hypothetical protein BDW02DRAFT_599073 [Decorospora gaudefroyi]
MPPHSPRAHESKPRINPIPSPFLGLLQATFVLCRDLLKYIQTDINSAIKDFLTLYGVFVAITAILWLG